MGMQDMIRWLLPREDVFYGLLERQSEILDTAARALAETVGPALETLKLIFSPLRTEMRSVYPINAAVTFNSQLADDIVARTRELRHDQ